MQFEVEIGKNDKGEWVATAVAYNISAKGLTENEALARVMDALNQHFKKQQ